MNAAHPYSYVLQAKFVVRNSWFLNCIVSTSILELHCPVHVAATELS